MLNEIRSGLAGQPAPVASIVCTTFNHADYIENAIDSFLSQETDFPYEIIIHDDASTDGTREQLVEYQKNNPGKVRLLLQDENQFSKGGFKPLVYASNFASSDLIFFCEGDDYWINSNKLQQQYIKSLEHPNVDLFFHPATEIRPDHSEAISSNHSDFEWLVPLHRVILGTGGFCPTASIAIRKNALNKMPEALIEQMPCGDVFFQIFGAANSGALFLPDLRSVYRVHSSNSFSKQLDQSSLEKKVEFNERMAHCYDLTREETNKLLASISLRYMAWKYRNKKNRKLLRKQGNR